ncbi:hypothetical protein CLOP_g20128, partial [Closterium sp. NIES-67]
DASDQAVGAVLTQDQGNGLQPIAYLSKKLHGAEQNYLIHDKEVLAIVITFKTWRCYLEGRKTTVYTDHCNLKYLKTQPDLFRRQVLWIDYLETPFQYDIVYKPGHKNKADALSRPAQVAAIQVRDGSATLGTLHTRHPWFKCFSRPEGWAPPGMKPPSGERAQGGAVQDEGAQGNAYPGMYLMVEDVHGHEGDVGSVGKVVMHPLTHWVIDSGCTSHMTPRADLLDEVALVKNRVLATVGDKEWIPYIKWYGSAPAVNMLRAFGCMVVFHVPKEKRGKLEASGRWGVHLGIAKDHKGWLLWDLTTQKLTVSRDVKFLESLYYKEWKQQQQKLPSTPLIVEADEFT